MEHDQTSLPIPHAIPAAEADVGDARNLLSCVRKGAETRHLVPCCYELAMDLHKQQRSAHSLIVRELFEQLCGLYMTMSVEPFDSAACARCSRQFCTLYKAFVHPTTTFGR